MFGNEFSFELWEVTRCDQPGLAESPFVTSEESIGIMELLNRGASIAERELSQRFCLAPAVPSRSHFHGT